MLRAGGPGEGDDSKEANIAVALPTTDAMVDGETRLKIMIGLLARLRMQRNKGISKPHTLIKIMEDWKIPLGEGEAKLHSIKGKVERDLLIVEGGPAFLARPIWEGERVAEGNEKLRGH